MTIQPTTNQTVEPYPTKNSEKGDKRIEELSSIALAQTSLTTKKLINQATLLTNLDPYTLQELSTLSILNELCDDPYRLYDNLDKLLPLINPALLDLRMCRCGKMSSQLRASIENSAIECLLSSRDPSALLTIVSVGSGGCYQELVYLARLSKAGYCNIQLVVIEPKPVPLQSFASVCQTYLPHSKINVICYPTVRDYQENPIKPNLLLLLDLLDNSCKVNGKLLLNYSFEALHNSHILQKNTVVAWNVLEENEELKNDPKKESLFSIGYCGLYSEADVNLSKFFQKKVAGSHCILGNSQLPPYQRDFSVKNPNS